MSPYILFPEDIEQSSIRTIGGKAKNLWLLRRMGFRVPPFFVITTALFEEAVLESEDVARHLRGMRRCLRDEARGPRNEERSYREDLSEVLAALAGSVSQVSFPFEFLSGLEASLERLEGLRRPPGSSAAPELPGSGFSVRSSATLEDAPDRSFAGQFTTILGVRGAPAVLEAIRTCWAAVFKEEVQAYRTDGRRRSAFGAFPKMAVVVQLIVEGDVSGVAFSADPVAQDHTTVLVSAAYGACDGVVDDRVATDTYRVGPDGKESSRTICTQTHRSVLGPGGGGGTRLEEVDEELRDAPTLSREEVESLAGRVREVADLYGVPVDVEWTRAGGTVHILQARPITTLTKKDPAAQPRLIWDNSNIVESYSGVTSPLTFTFASSGYAVIYRQFGKLVGDSEAFLKAHEKELANMLGLHKGRVYYNLLNWYLAVYYLPGFRFNKGAMEAMMGVSQSMDFKVPTGPMSFREKWLHEVPALIYCMARILWHFVFADRLVARFEQNFARVYGEAMSLDLGRMPVPSLLEKAGEVRQDLMYRWTAPIMTDCLAMVFMKLLRDKADTWVDGSRPGLANDLLAGEGGIESTKPSKALVELSSRIREDEWVRSFVESHDEEQILEELPREPRLAYVHEAVERYRDRYGFRCIGELKLEHDSIKDDPRFVITMLKNYIQLPGLDLASMEARERTLRREAEAHVEAHLRPGALLGRWWRRRVFGWILRNARKHVKNRENMRFARTRIFGFFREVFNTVGLKFAAAGLLSHPKDIYYLTLDEVYAFVEGRSVTQDIQSLARLRYEEYLRFRDEDVPQRFTTHGVVYAPGNQRPDSEEGNGSAGTASVSLPEGFEEEGRYLAGVGACPGQVRGRARVIRDAGDDLRLRGEILVAPRTDPGWVPLFPAASGLLIESGSVLSHSAIVARELGIPTIVGVKGLIENIQDGQEISMDAGQGVVDLRPPAVEPQAAPPPAPQA